MKMIKVAALAALTSLAASQAKALFDVEVFGGYTILNPTDINDAIKNSSAASKTNINGGYFVGAEAGITVLPFLKIGPRLEYVMGSQGKVSDANGDFDTVDISAFNPMLGLAFDTGLPLTGLSVKGGIYGGYGLSTYTGNSKASNVASGFVANGGGFVAEVSAEIRYKIIPLISFGLQAGYRLENITEQKITSVSGATSPLLVNSILKKANNSNYNLDLSGINIGGALAFNF